MRYEIRVAEYEGRRYVCLGKEAATSTSYRAEFARPLAPNDPPLLSDAFVQMDGSGISFEVDRCRYYEGAGQFFRVECLTDGEASEWYIKASPLMDAMTNFLIPSSDDEDIYIDYPEQEKAMMFFLGYLDAVRKGEGFKTSDAPAFRLSKLVRVEAAA